jgi:CheY-like chemotaxis protein
MLRVVLKRLGFEVRIVHDGLAALAEAKAFLPHYILTDVTLPGMTGVELAEALRKSEAYDSIRIFAVTGHSADRLPTPSPFDAHVMKPVDHARLEKLLLIT